MATSAGDEISCISGETLEKAQHELGENPETRGAIIQELRDKIEQWEPSPEEEGLTFSRKDDQFLLRYLRAKKFDTERALQLYVNYHKYRKKYADLLGEITPKAAEHILRSGLVSVLPERSKSGCKVVVIRAVLWDIDTMPPEDVLKTYLLLLDRLIEEEETQVHGFVLFEDLSGIDFYRIFRLARTEQLRKGVVVELLQEAFPARFKGVHVLNQPWYISIIMAIVRPFLKQKLKERIHMHGADYASLHEFLPPEHLPAEFGGHLPPLDTYSAAKLFEAELAAS